ncbi:UNVERIFIED_CONTAM: Lysosomal beta glucosidase [Sesamum angustifolium]|uniref:beta-glucosidase n=1 Tax=Sesamum angustifolium TaxID=2727405 RepID=A0AAW2QPW8_9LAMI
MGRVTAALVALWLWTAVVEAGYMKYKDPKQPLNVRIKDLISRMSLEEKIGQMTQIERKGYCEWGGSVPGPKASAENWIDMVNEFQKGALSTRLGIPMIYGIDAVHGHNNVYNATIFPHNVGLGVTRQVRLQDQLDPELVKRIGAATALEVRATGIHYTFAPCMQGPQMGRCYESYSEDHQIVQSMTEIITWSTRRCTIRLSKKLPICESKGFVISDMWGIDRITTPSRANYTYSVQAGIHAGIDMVMVPEEYVEFIDDLTLLVKKNVISMSRINDAVRRILRVKFIMGLFENPMADLRLDHRELAREAVRKSLVLLKNGKNSNEPLLPLPTSAKKILVAGGHADDIGNQCGGWTIEWNGQTGNITVGTTILTAVKNSVDESTVVVGELPYVETNGDSKNLTIAEPGYSTIANVCEFVKCVVIIISGRPVYIEPYLEKIDALVAAWLPGTEGQGITDVLFGEYGFTGKLARTWFRTVDQLPMNIGDPHYDPLFPFGYGLTTSPRLLKASQ